jgi:hypothetical protein
MEVVGVLIKKLNVGKNISMGGERIWHDHGDKERNG